MENIFFKSNVQKILRVLLEHPQEALLPSEIRKETRISRAGVHSGLQELLKRGLVKRELKGRAYVYKAKTDLPALRQIKVVDCIIKLQSLIKTLSSFVDRIILFGSCARGENTKESDIDLFIVVHDKDRVNQELKKLSKFNLKPILKKPLEFLELKKEDPDFYLEVSRGIILFEKENEH